MRREVYRNCFEVLQGWANTRIKALAERIASTKLGWVMANARDECHYSQYAADRENRFSDQTLFRDVENACIIQPL